MNRLLFVPLLAAALYGQAPVSDAERALAQGSVDLALLEQVTRSLIESDRHDASERALRYARRYQEVVQQLLRDQPDRKDLSLALGRALRYEARAAGNLGRAAQAAALAGRAFETDHTIESAREAALWMGRAGQPEDASRYLVEAVRLGDNSNANLTDFMQFTLSGLDGDRLALASLKGKAVVMDFWATWCEPCREQHRLFEQIKQRFHSNPDVVFLSISTDEDRQAVPPFLQDHDWKDKVYFEDGLERALRVTALPTSIIIGRDGKVSSRMNGFVGLRFVERISDQIRQVLAAP